MIGGIDPGSAVMAQGVRGVGAVGASGNARFESVLRDEVYRGGPGTVREDAAGKARRAAESFVSLALVQPVLKQLRETNMAAAPFAPGAAEKQFGPLLDAEISKRITEASHYPLVDRVAQDLLKRLERAEVRAEGALG